MTEDYKKYIKGSKRKPNPETKQVVKSDKWDKKRLDQVTDEVKEFVIANNELGGKVDTGFEIMGDAFYSLVKAVPKLKDKPDIRPSYMINKAVMDEAMGLQEYEELRQATIGDPISAALGCVAMEEQFEIIFDKMQEAQEQAKKIEQMLQQMEAMQGEGEGGEEMDADALMDNIDDLTPDDDGEGQGNQNDALVEEELKMLQDMIDKETEALEEIIEKELPGAASSIKAAVKAGVDAVGDKSFDAWGLQPGGAKKLPVGQRLELAKKLNTPKFKKMTEIIGRLQRLAVAEQHSKAIATQDEIYDVGLGNDLARVLPASMMLMGDEVFQYDWMRKFAERALPQYELNGEEKVDKGGIFLLEDGSGSMAGDREIYAKAIGLALLKIATMQKRPFHCVHFGGVDEYKLFSYDTSGPTLKCTVEYKKNITEYSGIESIMAFAECFYSGGTSFITPMSVALAEIQKENKQFNAVQSDIVFLTDGQCNVPDSFMKTFKEEQARLGFKVFGINIGGSQKSEPLYTICDTKVIVPKDLMGGGDVKDLFGTI